MILSCPSCATQYKVNDAVLGARGRTVRCVACKTTWHAETPIDLRYSEGRPKEDDEDDGEDVAAGKKKDLKAVKAKKLPGKYRAMLEDKKRLRAVAIEGMVWGGLAAVAVLVLALGYFLRVDVVRTFPRIAGAYAMVGLKVNGTNLQFGTHTADAGLKGGRFVVTVKAEVKNLSDQPTPVPPVRVRMYDTTLQAFNTVLMPAGGLVVAPHATRTLTFDVADPSNRVASLDLDFDLVAMNKLRNARPGSKTATPAHGGEHEAGEHESTPAAEHGEHAVAEDGAPSGTEGEGHAATDTASPHTNQMAAGESAPTAMDSDTGHDTTQNNGDAVSDGHPLSNRAAPGLRPALSAHDGHGTGEG